MNEIKTSCAPADSRNLTWDGMNWSKCETYVRKLQARIVKAQKEGRHNKVKTLQWMLKMCIRDRCCFLYSGKSITLSSCLLDKHTCYEQCNNHFILHTNTV